MRFREFAQPLFELNVKTRDRAIARFQAENPQLTREEITHMLDKWETYIDTMDPTVRRQVSDINTVSWQQLATAVDDAEALANLKRTRSQPNPANLEPIYNNNNLVIYRGDSKPKCIHYGQGYSWCISRTDASNLFNNYRYGRAEPMFYFVFDRDRDQEDDWHAVVIHVSRNGKFTVTTGPNPGDRPITWRELVSHHPKLANLKHVFQPQPLTDREREDHDRFSQPMTAREFDNLTVREKIRAIEFGMPLTDLQQASLPYPLLKLYANNNFSSLSRGSWLRLKPGDFRYAIRRQINDNQSVDLYKAAPDYLDPDLTPAQQKGLVDVFTKDINVFISYTHAVASRKNGFVERWPAAEEKISSSAKWALHYAIQLSGRWPEPHRDTAEASIAQDPDTAVRYALLLGGRWPEPHRERAEKTMAQNPNAAVRYAQELGGRWPEPHRERAEKTMAQDPNAAVRYAQELGGRWPEPHRERAEKTMAQDPIVASGYALLLAGRWPEPHRDIAEKTMAQNPNAAVRYAQVLGGRWPEPHRERAEKTMARNPNAAVRYAQVLGGRWPEPHRDTAEANMAQNPDAAVRYAQVLGGRWPEPHRDTAEASITTNSSYTRMYNALTGMLFMHWPDDELYTNW